jgi:hypothetical protein
MALSLVWTKRAVRGFDAIVQYLIEKVEYPEFLQKTGRHKNVYRGPMNKLTVITYRVKPRKQQIEIINVRGTRQKPLK